MTELTEIREGLNEHLRECAATNARTTAELASLGEKVTRLQSVVTWAACAMITVLLTSVGALFLLLLKSKGIG